jgi:hypothetical protein
MFPETKPIYRYPAEKLLVQIKELDAHISRLLIQAKELQNHIRNK